MSRASCAFFYIYFRWAWWRDDNFGQVTEKEQIDNFGNELDALIERFRNEYEISYASMVGALEMKIHLLCAEAFKRGDEV